ncbi:MAG: ATP-dependent Clp protease ATP-binding subunit, partial [Spirochaetales bacterium]|nr:ATP-dependent Clp protease ATP-binding subunit [Spirochaetales bacterium]
MFQKYLRICTEKVIQAINIGTMELANMRQNVYTPDFILLGLLEQEETMVTRILDEISEDSAKLSETISDRIYKNQPQNSDETIDYNADSINILLSPEIEQLFEIALDETRKLGDKFISTGSLFLAFFNPTIQPGCEYLGQCGLRYAEVYDNCVKIRNGIPINSKDAESKEDMLKVYGKDLVEMAQSDKLDPVVGRDEEISRIIEILARRTKNNPIIIGQPGVGKTALVEGLAQRIAASKVPETLLHRKVLQLDMARIVAGAKFKGEYEERMKNVIDSLVNTFGRTIAFIDDIHSLVDAGGNGTMRAIDMLSPVIARGEIQLIGTTSTELYKKTIEKEKTLARRFQPLKVDEPTVDETVCILKGIKGKYEAHHNVVYSDEALKAAATMSNRYVNDRFLPDKAIDLMDEAGAKRHLQMITIPPDIQELENAKKSLRREQNGAFVSNAFENVIAIQNKINDLDARLNQKKSDWDRELAEKSNIVTEEDIAA